MIEAYEQLRRERDHERHFRLQRTAVSRDDGTAQHQLRLVLSREELKLSGEYNSLSHGTHFLKTKSKALIYKRGIDPWDDSVFLLSFPSFQC